MHVLRMKGLDEHCSFLGFECGVTKDSAGVEAPDPTGKLLTDRAISTIEQTHGVFIVVAL